MNDQFWSGMLVKIKWNIIKTFHILQTIQNRMLITGGCGSRKTNILLNLIENQPKIDKIYFYTNDLYEAKYLYLIDKREGVAINHFNDPKAFIEFSSDAGIVYKNIDDHNPDKENKLFKFLMIWVLMWFRTKS